MLVGYARVSTTEQTLDSQIDSLKKAGCTKIFAEKVTGTTAERPQYLAMIDYIRDGKDTVVVYKLDRLGRSMKHLITEVEKFKERNIEFKSLQENIDSSTPTGKLFFHIFSSIAEFERDIIVQRTKAGLEAARARGRMGGKKPKLNPEQIKRLKRMYADKSNSVKDICETFNIGKTTLFKWIKNENK